MKPGEAGVGETNDEAGFAEVVDFGNWGNAVEEGFFLRRSFGGTALYADGEAFAEPVIEADEALIETLEGGLEADEAKPGVEHGEGAGNLIGIGEDRDGAFAIGKPDFEAFGKAAGEGIDFRLRGDGRKGVVDALRFTGGGDVDGFGRIGEVDSEDGGDADAIAEVGVVVTCGFSDVIAAEHSGTGFFEEGTQTGGRDGVRHGRNFQFETGHAGPQTGC